LEQAVAAAEERLAAAQDRSAAAKKLLRSADEAAEKFGKDNPDLIEARDRAKKVVASSDKGLSEAKAALQKAKDALKEKK